MKYKYPLKQGFSLLQNLQMYECIFDSVYRSHYHSYKRSIGINF